MNYCGECGNLIKDNYNFCGNCGTKITKKEDNRYDEILCSINGILVALVSKIAKTDGRVCEEEASYISTLINQISKYETDIPNTKEIYKQIINNEKDDFSNINTLCQKLIEINITEKEIFFIIEILLELAHADSSYDENEENIIVKIVHNLNLDFKIYQNIKNKYTKSESNNNQSKEENTTNDNNFNKNSNAFNGTLSIKEAFEVLESNETDTNKVIKDKYRRLAKQYHYDSIVSKDLPKDLIDFAEEKLKIINSAYEKVKKYKGI